MTVRAEAAEQQIKDNAQALAVRDGRDMSALHLLGITHLPSAL
jgi:rhodanese-related sulfurtransferase